MSTIKRHVFNDSRLETQPKEQWGIKLCYAHPNIFDDIPTVKMKNNNAAGFCRHIFTSLTQSVMDRFCLITDDESWELIEADFGLDNIHYDCIQVAYTDDSEEFALLDHVLRMICDRGITDCEDDRTIILAKVSLVSKSAKFSDVKTRIYKGSMFSIMQNFYNVVTKFTDYKSSHVALTVDTLLTLFEAFIVDHIQSVVYDQTGAIRFLFDKTSLTERQQMGISLYTPIVTTIAGYINDMVITSTKVWKTAYEETR